MSLDSTQTGSIGAIAAPIATLLGGPVAGLAVGGVASLFTGRAAADEQRDLTARNVRATEEAQRANEVRQRRTDEAVQGRVRQRVASSGFTSRGSPIERLGEIVAAQEENILISRFETQNQIADIQFRGEFRAKQTEAVGLATFSSLLGKSGKTLLSRIEPDSFFGGLLV